MGTKRLGGNGIGGDSGMMGGGGGGGGGKRLGLKIVAKGLGGKCLGGETSCYQTLDKSQRE